MEFVTLLSFRIDSLNHTLSSQTIRVGCDEVPIRQITNCGLDHIVRTNAFKRPIQLSCRDLARAFAPSSLTKKCQDFFGQLRHRCQRYTPMT